MPAMRRKAKKTRNFWRRLALDVQTTQMRLRHVQDQVEEKELFNPVLKRKSKSKFRL